jgi:hypothetical protein
MRHAHGDTPVAISSGALVVSTHRRSRLDPASRSVTRPDSAGQKVDSAIEDLKLENHFSFGLAAGGGRLPCPCRP